MFTSVDSHYFDVLPLHPAPKSLESLMSYLTRIAEANVMNDPRELSRLLGVPIWELTRYPDYSPLSLGSMAVRTTCLKEQLMACTLFHLERKFRRCRSDPANALSRFLRSSLSPSLRYCPLCLADDLYYSLKWRFLPVTGCSIHRCQLLDRCASCENALPLFALPPKMGRCFFCRGDLRSCPVQELTEQEMRVVHDRTGDIEFLLSPHACGEANDTLKRVGCRFAALRRKRHMSVQPIADAIGIPVYEIMGIEQGNADRYVSFDGYIQYAEYLGKTLKEMFLESTVQNGDRVDPTHETSNTDPFEEHESIVFEHMQEVVVRITTCGEKTSMTTIMRYMRQMHIPFQLLKQYSSVNAMVKQLVLDAQKERQNECRRRLQRREEDLVEQVHVVITQLKSSGQLVYQAAISRAVGLPTNALKRYPRVESILQQVRQECYLGRRKNAQNNGNQITSDQNTELEGSRE